MTPAPFGTYVHVPWCRARCPYCAFAIEPLAEGPPAEAFVARVLRERDQRTAFVGRPATLYLGGGTPSRLPPAAIGALVAALGPAAGEVTVEANPEDLAADPAWLPEVVAAGVNRVSLGVQSTEPRIARRLGRGHTQRHAAGAMAAVARAGLRSWSVDLMFAVPGQSLDDLRSDVDTVLGAGAPHVSVYGLTIEPGTRFGGATGRRRAGFGTGDPDVDEDTWRAMYDLLVERLSDAGLARYEVSNFARPDHRSAHNAGYWSDRPYLGLGPAAHGYAPDGARYVNVAGADAYLVATDPTATTEHPTGRDRAIDLLVSGMRAVDGVDLDVLRARTGFVPADNAVDALVRGGTLTRAGRRLALTHAAFPIADAAIGRLIAALVPN